MPGSFHFHSDSLAHLGFTQPLQVFNAVSVVDRAAPFSHLFQKNGRRAGDEGEGSCSAQREQKKFQYGLHPTQYIVIPHPDHPKALLIEVGRSCAIMLPSGRFVVL